VLYLVMEICMYVSELLCYALVGFSSRYFVVLALLIYAILFVIASIFFLARRAEK